MTNQPLQAAGRMPRQIPFIIANEGCERFSFYGMRNILTVFLMTSLLLSIPEAMRKDEAKEIFHTFVIGVYFFPLLGGWVAHRWFGKYHTILWLSLVYCAGHACLAFFESNLHGFYLGLFLIALGSGGIKPLVSAFVGDQFDKSNRSLAQKVFEAFYWIINLGSFFASLFMPLILKKFGGAVAFGIPGVFMFIATVIFWSARRSYVHVKPAAHEDPNSFLKVVRTALSQAPAGRAVALAGIVLAGVALAFWNDLGVVAALCTALVLVIGFGGAGAWMGLERATPKHGPRAGGADGAPARAPLVLGPGTPLLALFHPK